MQHQRISTPSGYCVPVNWFTASEPVGNIILLPALGVAAWFYAMFAEALTSLQMNVALVEQRGHGESALRPSRKVDFGLREGLEEDIPATMQWLQQQAPDKPLYLMGHSLGGHYAAITAGRFADRVAGLILIACGSPWPGGFQGKTHWQLRLLCRALPLMNAVLPYYPGDRLGFGGREARGLMADWLVLAKTNKYIVKGMQEDLERGVACYSGPVLSLSLDSDLFAPKAAVDGVVNKFVSASVSNKLMSASQLGEIADHFRWARSPTAMVAEIGDWLNMTGLIYSSPSSMVG